MKTPHWELIRVQAVAALPNGGRCRECGEGTVRLLAKRGRHARYKQFANLQVPADLKIPTCDRCGTEWANDETAAAFDAAMEVVYQATLRRIAQQSIERIVQEVEQGIIERALGLSAGYISKIKHGERNPSADLTAHLHSIAVSPKKRIKELEKTWELPGTRKKAG